MSRFGTALLGMILGALFAVPAVAQTGRPMIVQQYQSGYGSAYYGLGADSTGRIFFTDGNYIYRWDLPHSSNSPQVILGSSPAISPPRGLAVSASGAIYWTAADNTVRRMTPSGVVSVLAGPATNYVTGYRDGPGATALFNSPQALAVDGSGNVFVWDAANNVIRRIAADGTVTTLAGRAGQTGNVDGAGDTARFAAINALLLSPEGDLLVAENYRVRRINSAGVVTTWLGSTTAGAADGSATQARFNLIKSMSFGADGNLYLLETGNRTLRRVTPGGDVAVVAGRFNNSTFATVDGAGSTVSFYGSTNMTAMPDGALLVGENSIFRRAAPDGVPAPPVIAVQPVSVTAPVGGTAQFSVTAYGTPAPSYSWSKAGVTLVGSTSSTLTLTNVSAADAASYTVTVTNNLGSVTSTAAPLAVSAIATNDAFSSRTALSGAAAGSRAALLGATRESGEPAHNGSGTGGSVWWTWTAPSTGFVTFDASSSTSSVVLKLYTGTAINALASVAAAPAYESTNSANRVTVAVTAGTAYQIAIEPAAGATSVAEARLSLGYAAVVQAVAGDSANWYGNGTADGTGSAASFYVTWGIVRDTSGNFFVTDQSANTIRKITPAGVVTTFAGTATTSGSANGTGTAATFWNPAGLAIDASNNLYVADSNSQLIRKVTPAGVVTTLAGTAGTSGFTNATGTAAKFSQPVGVAVDASNNVYVADYLNHAIRKITSAGVVTTLAGNGTAATIDGTGTAAQFNGPFGLAISGTTLYVAEIGSYALRAVNTSTGAVTTIASGLPSYGPGLAVDVSGNVYLSGYGSIYRVSPTGVVAKVMGNSSNSTYVDGDGLSATFRESYGLLFDPAGTLWFTSSNTVRKATPTSASLAPYLVTAPVSQTVTAGSTATLTVRAFGGPTMNYQWSKDGTPIPGATFASLSLPNTSAADGGNYTVTVSNPSGTITPAAATLTVVPLAPNDSFSSATALSPTTTATATGYNYSATRETSEPQPTPTNSTTYAAGRTVWWKWTAPNDGMIVVDTAGSSVDNVLAAYAGSALASLERLAYGASATTNNLRRAARIYVPVVAGSTYSFQVDSGYYATAGSLRLNLTYAYTVTGYAGAVNSYGSTDGNLTTARFGSPQGLLLDPDGNLFVAETGNRTIRKIAADGTVTTLAGSPGLSGTTDGTGSAARFTSPTSIARDPAGNLYVTDQSAHTVRRITPAGDVTTLAGTAGTSGSADGTGTAATFNYPRGIAYGADGALYVSDSSNRCIRRVTLAGVVTTLAGMAGQYGTTDGTGSAASFISASDIAAGPDGNLYVADSYLLRRVTLAGAVTTIAGNAAAQPDSDEFGLLAGLSPTNRIAIDDAGRIFLGTSPLWAGLRRYDTDGHLVTLAGLISSASTISVLDGTGNNARLAPLAGIAVAPDGKVYFSDANTQQIRRATPSYAPLKPTVTSTPAPQSILAGATATLTVGFSGAPTPTFTWFRDGNQIAVTSTATLIIPNVQPSDAGSYTVTLDNASGTATSAAFTLTVIPQAANDSFANRISLTGESVSTSSDNSLATVESGEPVHYENSGGHSVWWSWTAPSDGTIIVDTSGSAIATLLAVYRGTSVDQLTPLGSGGSHVSVNVQAGSVYQIAVDGRAGAVGALQLNIVYALAAFTVATPGSYAARSMVTDASGNAWFTANDHTVRQITPDGTITIIAGLSGTSGTVDGVGTAARFNLPLGIARASDGTLYVSEYAGQTIRKILPNGTVSTLAGLAGTTGTTAGTGAAARFNCPWGLALDATGTYLYVADYNNYAVRRIEVATGIVTNFAGNPGSRATSTLHDGTGIGARFYSPMALTMAPDGNLYVCDSGMYVVRRVTPAAVVTTFSGTRFSGGGVDGPSSAVRYQALQGIACDENGNLLISDNNTVRRLDVTTGRVLTVLGQFPQSTLSSNQGNADGAGDFALFTNLGSIAFTSSGTGWLSDMSSSRICRVQASTVQQAPLIVSAPQSATAFSGGTVYLSVQAYGVPATYVYQWSRNGTPINGATDATLTLANVTTAQSGNYTVAVTNTAGTTTSAAAVVTINDRPANDSFASAVTLTGASPGASQSNAGATLEASEPVIAGSYGGASLWWKWTAPASGAVIADTAGSSTKAIIGVYTGSTLQNLTLIGSAIPAAPTASVPNPRPTAVMFTAVEGTTYYFSVDGDFGSAGTMVLHLSFTYNFTTLAGLAGSSGTTNGIGSAARFNRPNGSCVDASGNVYVADLNNHAIRKIAPDGTVTTFAGLAGTAGYTNATGTSARFNYPTGIVLAPDGNFYVTDGSNHAIRKVTAAGVVTTFAGPTSAATGTTDGTSTAARFSSPAAIAVDAAGNLYIADSQNHAIRKVTTGAVVTTIAGLKGTSGALDGTGTAARFNGPEGIAVDTVGNLYVADYSNHAIRKITPAGVVTTLAGALATSGYVDADLTAARFSGPNGVTALADGSVLVAEYGNSLLRKITTDGYVLTLAGTVAGYADGTGLGIKFNGPATIAVDASGRLYIPDQNNHVIRRGILTSAPAAPSISLQPQGVRIISGSTVTLTSGALGNPFPTYQWKKGGVDVPGATGATLVLANAQPADSGSYTLVATNSLGSATSEAAVVNILPLPANDSFNNRSRLVGDSLALSAYNFSATAQSGEPSFAGEPASRSVWFTWTAPANGNVTFDTIGSSFDTRLAVYRGETLANLTLIAESASATGAKFSKVRFDVTAGDVYQIVVDGVGGASGDFRLTYDYSWNFTQYAGTINTAGTANGTLTAAQFNIPESIAFDAAGNIYIADSANHCIRKIAASNGAVTVFAGLAGTAGTANGTGTAARFNTPYGLAADSSGNLYVADTVNHAIRKIVISTGAVTTLAGTIGTSGYADGTGTAAKFYTPANVACDAAGNVYVTDYNNRVVRKITPAGVVTTFAGTANTVGNSPRYFNTPWGIAVDAAGNVYVADTADIRKITPDGTASYFAGDQNNATGYADGFGSVARFNTPAQLAIDAAGNLYVADYLNQVLRKVSPTGEVRTIGGHPGESAYLAGTADEAYFSNPVGIAVSSGGFMYVSSGGMHIVIVGGRQIAPRAPTIATQPFDQSAAAGSSVSFVVVSAGFPAPTYQWRKNGSPISGATSSILTLNNVGAGDVSSYDVVVTNASGTVTSRAAALTLAATPANDAFANAATLTGTSAFATGFSTTATAEAGEPAHAGAAAAKSLWWTWTAPSAGAVIVDTSGSAADTRLAVYTGSAVNSLSLIAENDDASAGGAARVQFNAVAGTTYRFAVDVNGSSNGAVRVAVDYAFVVTTLAGTSGLSGTANASGTLASFKNPYSVALDTTGNLFVADSGNHTIRKITPAGVVTTFAGSAGQAGTADGTGAAARFNTPTGIAIDAANTIYVTDAVNCTIRKITSAGVVTTIAGLAGTVGTADGPGTGARFNVPLDIALDPITNGGSSLLVSDFGNHTIRRVTNTGLVTTLAGTATQSGFVDGTGAAARFNQPRGLVVDGSANVYVADSANHTLRKITSAGVVTTVAGFPGSFGATDGAGGAARLWNPSDVAIDASGRLLVTQLGGGALRRIAADGTVSTVAGGTVGSVDGTSFAARFDAPLGLAVTNNGTAYVADYNNHLVRKLTPANLAAVAQTITFAALSDIGFTATPITLVASSSSGLTVEFEVVSGAASVSGNQLTLLGTGSITIRAKQPGNSSYLAATPVERTFTVTANFSSWLVDTFQPAEISNSALTGPNADYDHDGIPNLVEYALGLDPKSASTSGLPLVAKTSTDWTFTYTRPAARADVAYVVEYSTNLTSWTDVGVTLSPVTTGGATETWRATVPVSVGSNCFLRLKVTR